MYIEFLAKIADGRLSHRKKRLVAMLICFIIAMLALIAYSTHLALSLLIPIALVCYQLRTAVSSRNAIKDVKMRFDFNSDYLIWTRDDGEEVTQKKIAYRNAELIADNDGRCVFTYTDTKNKTATSVFYGPKDDLEELRINIQQRAK